jgi:HD-like signal output (HDOD) protein
VAVPEGWLSRERILEYEELRDESDLVQRISRLVPGVSRQEALFRFHLSRSVGLQSLDLPLLPTTATEVMLLGRDANARVQDYVRVVQTDPSLVSAIVRMANSSFYSAASASTSLDQAIVRIGLTEVERVAAIHIFRSRIFRVRGHDARVQELVRHGVQVSIAAQWVLRRVGVQRAEAFLAGLFHDVGKLFLLQTTGRIQQQLQWTPPPALVESAFAAFHTLVGEQASRTWGLPEAVCEAVRWHHEPQRAAESPIRQAVYLGNRLAHALERKDPESGICDADDPVMLAAGLSSDTLGELTSFVSSEIEAVSSAVGAA